MRRGACRLQRTLLAQFWLALLHRGQHKVAHARGGQAAQRARGEASGGAATNAHARGRCAPARRAAQPPQAGGQLARLAAAQGARAPPPPPPHASSARAATHRFRRAPMAPTAIMYRFFAPVLSAQFMLRGDEGAQGRERESARGPDQPSAARRRHPPLQTALLATARTRDAAASTHTAPTGSAIEMRNCRGGRNGAAAAVDGGGGERRQAGVAAEHMGRARKRNQQPAKRKTNLLASDQPTPVRHSRAGGAEDVQAAALRTRVCGRFRKGNFAIFFDRRRQMQTRALPLASPAR